MERIAPAELVAKLWAYRIGGQPIFVRVPNLVVGGGHFLRSVKIDRFKQPRAEDVRRLVLFRRVEGSGASDGNAFGFGHGAGGPFVLLLIGVVGVVVFSDSKGVDERNLGR